MRFFGGAEREYGVSGIERCELFDSGFADWGVLPTFAGQSDQLRLQLGHATRVL